MTFTELLKIEKRWHKRAIIINLYHKSMLLKRKGKWTMRATAKKLDISLGAVSESIKLVKEMIDNPEIEKMKRDEALRVINK